MEDKNFLQTGDIFELNPGHTIYVKLPHLFTCSNGDSLEEIDEGTIKIGQVKHFFDTTFFAGEYIVTSTALQGGGNSHDGGYPDGHNIRAKKIMMGWRDSEKIVSRIEVNFYQSGSFTAKNPDIKAIRKAKINYTL